MPSDVPVGSPEGQDENSFSGILKTSLACGVLIVDEREKIHSLNPRAEFITRLTASRILHQSIDALPAPLPCIIRETISTGKPVVDRQLILHQGKPDAITLQINTALTGEGKNPGVAVVLNDISSARMWEANMRRLDRLHSVGALSASMAHEIKNAFVAIRTFVELLLEKDQQSDLAEIVRLELNRVDGIISQMLKFSGPAKPAFSPIQLHHVLDKSLKLIQHLLEEKRIEVTRSVPSAPDSLNGDHDQLEQAFLNLLFNALDAMRPNGQLKVSIEVLPPDPKFPGLPRPAIGPLLRVLIQDDGGGISPENMARIFEPFFTTKTEGTGLGLAITRRIIQDHGGSVSVHSEANQGTTFTLILPGS